MILKLLLKIFTFAFVCNSLLFSQALASSVLDQLTFGVGVGVGLTELAKDVLIEDTIQNANRSESPLVFQFLVEYDLNPKWTIGLKHSRGARLSPFSSGIGFTGLLGKFYFMKSRPYLSSPRTKERVTLMGWAPFVGLSSGFAVANTEREREVLSDIDSSGFYVALHAGVDYQMFTNYIFRPELIYATTLFDDTDQPATISQLGVVINLMFKL